MLDSVVLINEIIQIKKQYANEVSGDRKAWPKSIKDRVLELIENGMSRKQVSRLTEISYDTICQWFIQKNKNRPPDTSFQEVNIKNTPAVPTLKSGTVTVPKLEIPKNIEQKFNTSVTLLTPSGYTVTGSPVEVFELLKLMNQGGFSCF